MAPATCGLNPALFIKGIVNAPVVTVLAIALPEIDPKKPEARTATLAGPPVDLPATAMGRSIMNWPAPDFFRNYPKNINKIT
jgi:hypothetical protein